MRGLFLGPISQTLFLGVFLTGGVDHDAAVETIKQRILATKEGAGRREERKVEQTRKRKEISGKDSKPKRPRIEGSGGNASPLTEEEMVPPLVGGTPFSPRFQLLIFVLAKLKRLQCSCGTLEFVSTSGNEQEDHLLDYRHHWPEIVACIPGCSRRGTADLSRIEVAIVVKADESHDPFRDLHPLDERPATDNNARVEADTPDGMKTLGQMTTWVEAQMAQQLRPWAFSVVICGDYARLVRWDRSGAVFTSRFDYKTSDHMERFFTSYGGLDERSRGVDTSITILEDDDQRVKTAKEGFGFRPLHGPQPRFYEFRLGPDRSVVGYSPDSSTSSLIGKASRPFIVWDSAAQKKRFLKDTWRIDLPGMVVEGEIYELLESNQVPHVASVIWHGDVDEQQTLTSKLCVNLSDTYAMQPLTPHKHYRLVLDKVGRPCTEYNNQCHFFTIIRQATKGECGPPTHLLSPTHMLTSSQPIGRPTVSQGYCMATSACGIS